MRALRAALLPLILLAAACETTVAPAGSEAEDPALATTRVVLTTADGRTHRYTAEIAATPEQQARGLMYRRSMPRDRGMIFPMQPPRRASFWMQNTYLPLDIIFVGTDGRVLNVGRGVPESTAFVEAVGLTGAVLELNAGEAERIGLKPGDKVSWTQ